MLGSASFTHAREHNIYFDDTIQGLDPVHRTRTDSHDDGKSTRWATIKDRLAITAVIIALLLYALIAILDSIVNFQCSPWQFITFECNRFDAGFKPWN